MNPTEERTSGTAAEFLWEVSSQVVTLVDNELPQVCRERMAVDLKEQEPLRCLREQFLEQEHPTKTLVSGPSSLDALQGQPAALEQAPRIRPLAGDGSEVELEKSDVPSYSVFFWPGPRIDLAIGIQREQLLEVIAPEIDDMVASSIVALPAPSFVLWVVIAFATCTVAPPTGEQEISWIVLALRAKLHRLEVVDLCVEVSEKAVRADVVEEVVKEPIPIVGICPTANLRARCTELHPRHC